ncbi:MAG: hypothetical protein H0X30_15470 [Anaerolineae bacterium]|nr:hypothetical protein [Anaerolineae bacterium]
MFEHRRQQLLPRRAFLFRLGRFAGAAFLLVGISWLIGILGYRALEGMSWIDATLNAAMILGGMGPVAPLQTNAGKLFASFYALFSGIVFLVSVGVLIAPILHRFLHQFHLEAEKEQAEEDKEDEEEAKAAQEESDAD